MTSDHVIQIYFDQSVLLFGRVEVIIRYIHLCFITTIYVDVIKKKHP